MDVMLKNWETLTVLQRNTVVSHLEQSCDQENQEEWSHDQEEWSRDQEERSCD